MLTVINWQLPPKSDNQVFATSAHAKSEKSSGKADLIVSKKTGKVAECSNPECNKANHWLSQCPLLKKDIDGVKDLKKIKTTPAKSVTFSISNIFLQQGDANHNVQLLDNCCSDSLQMVNDPRLAANIRPATKPIIIGVGGDKLEILEICDTKHFGTAYYSLEAPFTIWSQARVAKFAKIQLLRNGETTRVTLPDKSVLDFTADPAFDGLMSHLTDADSPNVYLISAQPAAFAMVSSNMEGFTKIEIEQAKLVSVGHRLEWQLAKFALHYKGHR
jgi:hypothetical protein